MPFWNRTEKDKYLAEARKFRRGREFDRAGDNYALAGNDDEALEMYVAGGHHKLAAKMLEKLGDGKRAAEHYVKARDYRRAADLFVRFNDRKRASQIYERLGEFYKVAKLEEELRAFGRAAEFYVRSGHGDRAAVCYSRDKNFAKAGAVLEKYLVDHSAPTDQEMPRKQWEFCATLYERAGEVAKAAQIWLRLDDKARAAMSYEQGGEIGKAIEMFVMALDPEQAKAVYERHRPNDLDPLILAEIHYISSEWPQAAVLFRDNGQPRRAAECFERADDKAAAGEQYERGGELETAAEIFHGLGDLARAARLYESCLRLDMAARVAREGKDFERAAELYARNNAPADSARCWLELGKTEQAITQLQQIQSGDEAYREATVLLADAFRAKGLEQIAEEKYREVIGDGVNDDLTTEATYGLALLCESDGRYGEATDHHKRIVASNYGYRDSSERLEALKGRSSNTLVAPAPRATGDDTLFLQRDSPAASTTGTTGIFGERYEIVGRLGHSQDSDVYKAWDSSLGRTVAVKKFLHVDDNDSGIVRRFVHEAQQASKLHHSNIATIYDAIEAATARFVVMEYVYGQNLREILQAETCLTPGRALEIVLQIAVALEYAHGQGVTHRNLRPENVLLAEKSHVKLINFGLNRRYADLARDAYSDTSPLHYLSPEQIRGDKTDARSDVYALGCLIYEMVVGKPPHTGTECARRHLEERPASASELEPSVPSALNDVIMRCLEKDVAARFQTVRQLVESLRGFDFVPGQRIGERYELLSELGAGGMGKVYRARDLELSEEIAMKVLRPEFGTDPGLEQRFIREIKLARKISHPSVVKVFDFGKWNETKFITMEFIDGLSFDEYVKKRLPPNVQELSRFVVQLCEALGAAHRLGVIHRDIKPQNIIIARDGTAKIVDFGIARLDQTEDLTSSRHIVGSPKYMSPEQITGGKIDHRTDIYSMGVVMYFCFTGIEPFTAEDTNGIIMKQLRKNPTPPCQVNPDLPPWVEMIVLKCLVKDPAGRYQGMSEVVREFQAQMGD